jgi:antitoxin (DNA-binding transcriptional repressor) of toxin-antitoxin stability system
MSEAVVTVEYAALHLAELVEHISAKREAAVIVKAGRPMARLVPVLAPGELSDDLIDFLRRWRTQYPEPDEGLAEAIEASRRGVQPAHDPWE